MSNELDTYEFDDFVIEFISKISTHGSDSIITALKRHSPLAYNDFVSCLIDEKQKPVAMLFKKF